MSFLLTIESPFEIDDYIKQYLGDSRESNDFLKMFLERRLHCRKSTKKNSNDDDLCAPAKAINPFPALSDDGHQLRKKKSKESIKKIKKFSKTVDANILGFKATSDPNRIVGHIEIDDEY